MSDPSPQLLSRNVGEIIRVVQFDKQSGIKNGIAEKTIILDQKSVKGPKILSLVSDGKNIIELKGPKGEKYQLIASAPLHRGHSHHH